MTNNRDGAHDEYVWEAARPAHNHSYLAPALLELIGSADGRALLDIGCGNGALTAKFPLAGFQRVVGTEYSVSGLEQAVRAHPEIDFREHDVSDPLPSDLRGAFDVVVAAEVVEHLLLPRQLFARAREALAPGGRIVFTTPFHGYWKNLALALTGKFDHHWRPGWDYGHVKFFSEATLGSMAEECGFKVIEFRRVGRVPALAKSMMLYAEMT